MIQTRKNRSHISIIIFLCLSLCVTVFLTKAAEPEDVEISRYEQAADQLTGSPQAAAAVELTRQMMMDLGLTNIHLEPTRVGRWVRGEEETALIISSRWGTRPLKVASIGGSDSTPETGIEGRVIEVKNFEELKALGASAKGTIIFFNRPMDPALPDTFSAYGGAADQRVQGAVEGARAGAVAVLVRSLTTRRDDFPHTGLMQYKEGIPRIPAACVSTIGADDLSRLLLSDPDLRVHMKLDCRHLSPVISHNVIGEIEGSENPEEIVLVGGHLDSWDLGTGAHDDGAGCVHALEALRLIKETGLRPGGGGVNIGPLGQSGTLLIGLIPDSQRYFDVHHSALDTIETVNSRELEMGAIAIALLAHILAQEGIN